MCGCAVELEQLGPFVKFHLITKKRKKKRGIQRRAFSLFFFFTWRSNSVLIGRLIVVEREQQSLDGPDENPSQAKVEDHVEGDDFNFRRKGGGRGVKKRTVFKKTNPPLVI